MTETNTVANPARTRSVPANNNEVINNQSAVSWAAIFAGAAGAAALSLLLLIIGIGLGFSAVSPWNMAGISGTALGFAAILWLSFTQLAASGMGGYLAGRLRIKWTSVHSNEVYFRDTAHGFLTWAIASLLMVVVVTTVMGSIADTSVRAGAAVAGGAAGSAAALASNGADANDENSTIEYFVDSLFRADSSERRNREQARADSEIPAAEVTRIFARALRTGTLPQNDERYIARLIAERTDMSQQQSQQRVSEGFDNARATLEEAETTAREAADKARKASAYAALWMSVSLLIGAFTASLMAVYGGRQRDA